MTLITADELARAGILVVFGGGAGMGALLAPGSLIWAAPAFLGAVAMGFTVPEVRHELRESLPALREAVRALPRPAALLPQRGQTVAAAATVASAPTPSGTHAPAGTEPLRPRQWLHALNDRPDDNPHLTVVGPSGTGKTTFVAATLGQRGGRVVVLTPKVTPGAWRGAEVVTLDDDLSYAPLAAALNDLQTEAKQRSAKLRRGEPLEPMTVVLDELPELHAEIPGAGKFAVRLSRWGRELGMRQVVIATSDDALNIPGWAATRSNYARVVLEKPTAGGARHATLDDGQTQQRLDLGHVKAGAERAQLRPWRGEEGASMLVSRPAQAVSNAPTVSKPVSNDLLASLLAETLSSASGRQDIPATLSKSMTNALDTDLDRATVSMQLDPLDRVFTLNVNARAEATPASIPASIPASAPVGGRRMARGRGLDMRRRRHMAQARQIEDRKTELQTAYAARKAAGVSYSKAYAELGGNSTESRAWWKAASAATKEHSHV